MSIVDPRELAGRHLLSRRASLGNMAYGLSSIGLAGLLSQNNVLGSEIAEQGDPIRPQFRQPTLMLYEQHFVPKANKVLMIFCSGACSHLDTFDYKPELIKRNGQPMPGRNDSSHSRGSRAISRSPWAFKPRGESGKMVSTLVDHIGEHADEMALFIL